MTGGFLLYAFLTLLITRLASLGNHSPRHHQIARVAMTLELLLILVSGFARFSVTSQILWLNFGLGISIAGCFLAVFFTDDLEGWPWWKHALLKLTACFTLIFNTKGGLWYS